MATPYKMPFHVSLTTPGQRGSTDVPFARSAEEAESAGAVEIIENRPLQLYFSTHDKRARLYLGDLTPADAVESEEGDYLAPLAKWYTIRDNEDEAFIPGYYDVRAEVAGATYYARLLVRPAQMTTASWEMMWQELDEFLTGLADELTGERSRLRGGSGSSYVAAGKGSKDSKDRKGSSAAKGADGTADATAAPSAYGALGMAGLYQRLQFIEAHAGELITGLGRLMHRPKRELVTTYERIPAGLARTEDARTIRDAVRRPADSRRVLAPVKVMTYDTSANRLLKHDLTLALRSLMGLDDACTEYLAQLARRARENRRYGHAASVVARTQELIERWERSQARLRQVIHAVRFMLASPLMAEVGAGVRTAAAAAHSLLDARYQHIHQLLASLQRSMAHRHLAKGYYTRRRRTDKLYELWCFIQVHRELAELGFAPTDGWIFSPDLPPYVIPMLAKGERVTYTRGEGSPMRLELVYDARLPRTAAECDDRTPLYQQHHHNRPDLRLDIWYGSVYAGCIVLETKYRRAAKVESDVRTIGQLVDYASLSSTRLYEGVELAQLLAPHAVRRVLVLTPRLDSARITLGDRIELLLLTPGEKNRLRVKLAAEIDAVERIMEQLAPQELQESKKLKIAN